MGKPAEEDLDALVRAADEAVERGDVLRAIGLCKRILAIEPGHIATEQCLHLLYAESVTGSSASGTEKGSPAPAQLERPSNTPLDELLLTEVVPGARPARMFDVTLDGVNEIPVVVDDPRDAADGPGAVLDLTETIDVPAPSGPLSPREALARTPLFGALAPSALRRVIELSRLVRLGEGEVLFREGDDADALYVVVDGAVVPVAEGDPRTRMAVLETGSFFGEIGLVTNQPRTATIEALVDTELLAIDRRVMWRILRAEPKIFAILLDFLRERLIDRLVHTSPLFAAFARDRRDEVARLFGFLEVRHDGAIIQQGDPVQALFVLLAGTLRVIHMGPAGDRQLATLLPGGLCGEMSLIEGKPAMASVVAQGKCWVLALPAGRFRRILSESPSLAELLLDLARQRDQQNRDRYHSSS